MSGIQLIAETGDVLGFTNERNIGAIGFSFRDATSLGVTYVAPLSERGLPAVNEGVLFEKTRLPYNFAVGAACDTGNHCSAVSGVNKPTLNILNYSGSMLPQM